MSSRSTMIWLRWDVVGQVVTPLLRQFWMIVLIVMVGGLASLAYSRMQVPKFEATAVVQMRPGVDGAAAERRLMARDNLIAMAERHGLIGATHGESRNRAAALLRQAIAVHDLTTSAGTTLGFQPGAAGIVVSVLLPDAELAARVANDLAQQVLDVGNAGNLGQASEELDFYRREEARLWQEISAQRAEIVVPPTSGSAIETAVAGQRRLALMQDEYDLVRARLAEHEVDARLMALSQSQQFSLLQRATSAEAIRVVHDWMLVGVAGSLLLAVALAFVLERRYPGLERGPWDDMVGVRARVKRLYRLFDDPTRPIMGLPRFLVISVVLVIWLVVFAQLIR
ncbi:MAG: hypothetical protein ABI832_09780 [bacterium]